jgi:hypothetical protein
MALNASDEGYSNDDEVSSRKKSLSVAPILLDQFLNVIGFELFYYSC